MKRDGMKGVPGSGDDTRTRWNDVEKADADERAYREAAKEIGKHTMTRDEYYERESS